MAINIVVLAQPYTKMESAACVLCGRPIEGAGAEYVVELVASHLAPPVATRPYEGVASRLTEIDGAAYFIPKGSFRRHFLSH